MNNPYQNSFFELLNVLSFYVGLQNLEENREQSKHNDVQLANDKQAQYLLQEINKRFDEQNSILLEQNVLICQLLEKIYERVAKNEQPRKT